MLKKIITRVKNQGFMSTVAYFACTVLLEKLGVEIVRLFVSNKTGKVVDDKRISLFMPDDSLPKNLLVQIEEKCGAKYIEKMNIKREAGHIIAIASIEECTASIAWLSKITETTSHVTKTYWIIHGCLTFAEYRGKQLYPSMIKILSSFVAQSKFQSKNVYIESSWTNKASINGIKKCGFSNAGYSISFRDKVLINKRIISG